MRILILSVLFELFFFTNIIAGSNNRVADSNYFVSYRDKLQLSLIGVVKFNSFDIHEKEKPKDDFGFSTNENFNIGFGCNYKWLGVNLAFNLPAYNSDDTLYGKTMGTDIQVDLHTDKWIFNATAIYYSGFYWQNPDDFYSNWSVEDSVVIHPDVSSVLLSVSGLRSFKYDKISLRSVFVGNEVQLKSAGSFIAGWQASLYGMNSDFPIIPEELISQYPNIGRTRKLSSLTLGFSFGYVYTHVFRNKMFANIAFMPGINAQTVTTREYDKFKPYVKPGLSTKMHLRAGVGYQTDVQYMGFMFIGDSYNLKTDFDTRYRYSYGKIKIYYGVRF